MKVFSGTANMPLAEKIASSLGLMLSPLDIFVFPDGEKRVRVEERIVDEHCIIVQPTNPPADSNYMELFFMIDALKRSGAASVTAVVPYLGYQRQDHVFRDGEAVSLEVIAKTIESTGVNRLLCLDLHSVKIPEVFTIPVKHLSALSLFAEYIQRIMNPSTDGLDSKEGSGHNSVVLVSPDMGGIARIKKLSGLLGSIPSAAIEKERDLITGKVESQTLGEGEITGQKTAFLVDDMISSGKTVAVAAQLLKKKGVENIYVFVTHALFSEDAPDVLQAAPIEKVVVTDAVLIPKKKQFPKLEILSISDIIANEITKSNSTSY